MTHGDKIAGWWMWKMIPSKTHHHAPQAPDASVAYHNKERVVSNALFSRLPLDHWIIHVWGEVAPCTNHYSTHVTLPSCWYGEHFVHDLTCLPACLPCCVSPSNSSSFYYLLLPPTASCPAYLCKRTRGSFAHLSPRAWQFAFKMVSFPPAPCPSQHHWPDLHYACVSNQQQTTTDHPRVVRTVLLCMCAPNIYTSINVYVKMEKARGRV